MSPTRTVSPLRTAADRGFALVVVVSLLALLMLALVSLATLTRIEAQVGVNSRKQAQARQNARFALDQALGELQRHAGVDMRATATAAVVGATSANRHWTGVWNSSNGALLTWLVSGNTPSIRYDPRSASIVGLPAANALTESVRVNDVPARLLAGRRTVGGASSRYVAAPMVELKEPIVGESGEHAVGRYAWWIADEGVKASMVLPDRWSEVAYGPYADADADFDDVQDGFELRARLRQQVPSAHQSFQGIFSPDIDRDGPPPPPLIPDFGWDPFANANRDMVGRVLTRDQLRYLSSENYENFGTVLRSRFHGWTTVARGVLASSHPAYPGLKSDLSQAPALLGIGFANWTNYEPRMEGFPSSSSIAPRIRNANDFRRRYRISPPETLEPEPAQVLSGISPLISNVVVQFLFRRVPAGPGLTDIEIRCRAHVEMWNPYTSALVPPERVVLEVSGFPEATFRSGIADFGPVSLQGLVNAFSGGGSSMRLILPFNTGNPDPDRTTWLPGRVFNWRTNDHEGTGSADLPLRFGAKHFSRTNGWQVAVIEDVALPDGPLEISGDGASLMVDVWSISDGSTVQLAKIRTPLMPAVGDWTASVPENATNDATSEAWCLAWGGRLPQPRSDAPLSAAWLSPTGIDPRDVDVPATGLVPHAPDEFSPVAEVYQGALRTNWDGTDGFAGLLLNRPTLEGDGGVASDTPAFELPRSPLLSLGALQHIHIAGAPPFSVGNSWGARIAPPAVDGYGGGTIGSWFDRFFFSGSVPAGANRSGVDDRDGASPVDPLPFYHLRAYAADGAPVSIGDLRSAAPYSSRHLLMDGAFNVNSTSVEAWEAVLRSLRPGAFDDWRVGDLDVSTGNAEESPDGESQSFIPQLVDSTQGIDAPTNRASGFMRFSQSLQECFESDTTNTFSGFNRTAYRQGFRGGDNGSGHTGGRNLSSIDIRRLAEEIVRQIRLHGPFRTLESFVDVVPTGTRSVIESAIDASGINAGRPFMSGYFLTQADVLTAIAPFLQCRSDTFLIRAYGETVNPLLDADHPDYITARAWCEATVQRIPTPVLDGDDPIDPTGPFGRRFVITSFRWLSPDDI